MRYKRRWNRQGRSTPLGARRALGLAINAAQIPNDIAAQRRTRAPSRSVRPSARRHRRAASIPASGPAGRSNPCPPTSRFPACPALSHTPSRAACRSSGASASAMVMVLPSAPGKSFRCSSVKRWNKPLQLARECDQRVPGAIHREIVAAGVQQVHLAPEFGQRAQHFHLAREELLVQHRKLDVLFDALQPPHADAEAVHIAPQHSPHASGPARGAPSVATVAADGRRRWARRGAPG